MEQLIQYAYLRKCTINAENVHELLISADYVGMIGLVTLCKQHLAAMLTPENCVSIMGFARWVRLWAEILTCMCLYVCFAESESNWCLMHLTYL